MPDLSAYVSNGPIETVTVTGTKPKPKTAPKAANTNSLGAAESDAVQKANLAEAAAGKEGQDINDLILKHQDVMAKLLDEAPKPPEDKPFQAPEQEDPIKAFGSKAMVLASIASLFTRAPLTASLNAMAGGMKAINEGNATNYTRAYDEWKTNTDAAFKRFEAENTHYNTLLGIDKASYEEKLAGITATATAAKDEAMIAATKAKGLESAEQLLMDRQRLNNETQANFLKVGMPAKILNMSIQEWQTKNPGKTMDSKTLSNLYQQAQSAGVGGMQSTAQMIASYQMPMPTGYAFKYMGGDSLVDAVKQLNPNYNAVKYGAINKAYDAFTSGPASTLIASGNVAIQHLSMLRDAADALQNHNFPAFNSLKQRYLQETGSAIPTNFDAISNIAADELVKFIVGGGKTGGALGDRKEMKELLTKAGYQNQLSSQLDDYVGLMAGQMDGQRKKYDADDLDYIKPFDDFLLPETQAALHQHSGVTGDGGFENGKIYTDASGNKAKYQDGKWVPVP